MVVDDNADMRLVLKAALELEGYAVETAENGRHALEAQRAQPVDVLITDLFMPESDGFEAIDAFRREFPTTRIVVVSGGGQRGKKNYLEAASLVGVDATLEKPFSVDALVATLRSFS